MSTDVPTDKKHSVWLYLRLRLIAAIIRLPLYLLWPILSRRRHGLVDKDQSIAPSETVSIPSSKQRRSIKLFIHRPNSTTGSTGQKLPVHLNWHGSGFVIPCHGYDAEFCSYIANSVPCIVIDCDYIKAPEHPFPAAYDDAMDAITYVRSHSDLWDINKITVGGYSAGANLALSACATLTKSVLCGAAVWYPPTDWTRRGWSDEKRMYKPFVKGKTPGVALGKTFRTFCDQSYVLPSQDSCDPRLSPMFADPTVFPDVFITAGDADPLCKEGEELVNKIKEVGGSAEFVLIPNGGHGWERLFDAKDETFRTLRKQTFDTIVKHLQKCNDGTSLNSLS